jgi:hypothetical protein
MQKPANIAGLILEISFKMLKVQMIHYRFHGFSTRFTGPLRTFPDELPYPVLNAADYC